MTKHYIKGEIIWLIYYVDGARIRKSTKLKNTPKNIKIVTSQIIPALDIKISTGDIHKKKPKTFKYYGELFITHQDSNKSFLLKQAYYKRPIKKFGHLDIDKITRLDIKNYLISLNMKNTSKNVYRSCIKAIFELAVDDGVIDNNPSLSIKFKPEPKEPIRYYTKEEVNKLLNIATGIIKPFLEIAFNTGLRTGEMLGLQLSDFKDDEYIHVQRTRTKGVIGTGKTVNANRYVPYASYILDEVKKIQGNNIFIFDNRSDAMHLRDVWSKVCKDANVPKYKLYSTRHTFATLMLKDNIVSINELAGLLGHSSPKVTLEHYASIIKPKMIDLGKDFSLFRHNTDTIKSKKVN